MNQPQRSEAESLRTEAGELRAILAAIADALDVPAGDDYAATLQLTRDRAILVKHAARDAVHLPVVAGESQWLRDAVAEHAPAPGEGSE
jgi:hypothetical protein